MNEIIKDLTITVKLPKEVLRNMQRAVYLESTDDFSGDLCIRSFRARSTLNKTIADMIVKEWE